MDEIKEFRKRLGLTQKALADRLGVNVLSVRRWEKGYNQPSTMAKALLKRLCQIKIK